MKKGVNPRNLLAIGLTIAAYSLWLMSGFALDGSFMTFTWPRVVQAVGMGLFFVPLSAATYVGIPREEMGNASGIFNLLRNLGGSFGVAFSTTVLAQRSQVHQSFLVENITPYNKAFQSFYAQLTEWFQMNQTHIHALPDKAAMAVTYREVLRQASMLAFNDTFWLLAIGTAVLVPLTLIFRRARAPAAPMEGMH